MEGLRTKTLSTTSQEKSRLFCHNFMKLILAIQSERDDKRTSFKLCILAFTAINLRDSVSLFNRHELMMKSFGLWKHFALVTSGPQFSF